MLAPKIGLFAWAYSTFFGMQACCAGGQYASLPYGIGSKRRHGLGQCHRNMHPFYEFLFIRENGSYNLTKKQKHYTYFAGIEGLECDNLAPIFS